MKAVAQPLATRALRRVRAIIRYVVRRVRESRTAIIFVSILAGVGVALFSPLLLDDLAFRASYLLRPSPDAITITEPTVVNDYPRMTVTSGTLSMPPALSGQARTREALTALIQGGSARLALKKPVIHLDLSASEDVQTDPVPSGHPFTANGSTQLIPALIDGAFETLTVRDGTIVLSSEGRTDTLEDVSADITVKRKTAVRIKGTFRLLGEQILVDATLGARMNRSAGTRTPVRAQIQSAIFNASIDGRFESGSTGLKITAPLSEINVPSLRALARWFGHTWPSGPGLKDFSARGSAEWSGRTISYPNGTFSIDGNEGQGAFAFSFDGLRPSVAGTLAFANADLTPYLAADHEDGHAADNTARSLIAHLRAARDLSLPLIGVIDADLRASADTVTAGNFQAGRSAVSLALKDGTLLVNVADMVLANGGTADGEISIERNGEDLLSYHGHGRFEGADLNGITTVLTGVPLLMGRGQGQFELKSAGRSGKDVLSRLNGQLRVQMPRGGVATCSIGELTAMAVASTTGSGCRATTSIGPFKSQAQLADGVLRLDRIELPSGGSRIRIDGTADIGTSSLHLLLSEIPPAELISNGETPPEPATPHDLIAIHGRTDDIKLTLPSKHSGQ